MWPARDDRQVLPQVERTISPIVAAAVLWLIGCTEAPSNSCVCTEEFRTYVIVVVNAAGTPVTNLTPSVTLVRTGQPITPLASPVGGTYPVLSDAELPLIQSSGDMVRFVVASGQESGTADITFAATPCRCHIEKVGGPDTLVLR